MEEVDSVLLSHREHPVVGEHIVVFETGFDAKEVILLVHAGMQTAEDAEAAVLEPCEAMLEEHAAIPEPPFPEHMADRFLPMVTALAVNLDGVAVTERMFIADCGVECIRSEYSGVDGDMRIAVTGFAARNGTMAMSQIRSLFIIICF